MTLHTLYQALQDSNPARLRTIAQLWDIALVSVRRADMAAELADAMARSVAVERILSGLTAAQRAALDDVLRHEGMLPWAIFVRRWGPMRPVGAGRVERDGLWRTPASPAEALWFHGLVHRAFVTWPRSPVEMAYVPEGLRLYLPRPEPRHLPPPPATKSPGPLLDRQDTLADTWVTWLQAAHARQDLSAIPQRDFLETLALEQGWVRRAAPGSYHLDPKSTLTWLQASPWEQWSAWFHAWANSSRWNDLAHVPTLDIAPYDLWPNESQPTRARFLVSLQQCQPGTPYDLSDFTAYVHKYFTDFLRPNGDYTTWSLYVAEASPPRLLHGFDSWFAVEGELIRYYLNGPLQLLGAVEMAPDSFRLTAAGAAWLGLADPPLLPPPPRPTVEASGTIRIPLRHRFARFQLSRVAQALACDAESCRFFLTPASLERAQQQHIRPQRVAEFLTEITGLPLPPPIQKLLS